MKKIINLFFLITFAGACAQNTEDLNSNKVENTGKPIWNTLTPEEERVILNKGTERPFIGTYTDFFESGVYVCKQCEAPLYKSDDKFHSNCGWPSFDDEIEGAVERVPDADGSRTEIVCANCKGHLGHVFLGEGFTAKETRHCVNSISLKFLSSEELKKRSESASEADTAVAIFASGCFWGTEYYFERKEGVLKTEVGYIGGTIDNPTYREVCTGTTGHAEATRVYYNPNVVSYEDLAKLFFETHDPSQVNRQGPDIGTQYRSAVFVQNEAEKAIIIDLVAQLKDQGIDVVTQIANASTFYIAEDYHQQYYTDKGTTPYCHFYQKKFKD